jgi:hypothetical protein
MQLYVPLLGFTLPWTALKSGDEDPKDHGGSGRSNDRNGLEPFPES